MQEREQGQDGVGSKNSKLKTLQFAAMNDMARNVSFDSERAGDVSVSNFEYDNDNSDNSLNDKYVNNGYYVGVERNSISNNNNNSNNNSNNNGNNNKDSGNTIVSMNSIRSTGGSINGTLSMISETGKYLYNGEALEHTHCEEWLYQFVQINAILQLMLDIVLEILHLVPMRINHLALTVINAFLAYKTLSAIRQNKFKFLHEDIQILVLLEICLILGDLFILVDPSCAELKKGWSLIGFYYTRATFIILSFYNLVVALYIMNKHKLYHLKYVGEKELHRPNSTRPGLRERLGMKPIDLHFHAPKLHIPHPHLPHPHLPHPHFAHHFHIHGPHLRPTPPQATKLTNDDSNTGINTNTNINNNNNNNNDQDLAAAGHAYGAPYKTPSQSNVDAAVATPSVPVASPSGPQGSRNRRATPQVGSISTPANMGLTQMKLDELNEIEIESNQLEDTTDTNIISGNDTNNNQNNKESVALTLADN